MSGVGEQIWASSCARDLAGRPALFLDRDGVVVEEVNYLHRIEDLRLTEGVAEMIHAARSLGAAVIVVTNQSGLARGLFDWAAYHAIEAEIARRLDALGCSLDATIACPFHPDFTPGYGAEHALWRKPGPGMIELAATRFGLDLPRSLLVGDNASDIEAARTAQLPGAIHVLLGHGPRYAQAASKLRTETFKVHSAADLDVVRALVLEIWGAR